MDVTNGATVNGTLVQLSTERTRRNGIGEARAWSIRNPVAGPTVPNAGGTQLDIYDCNGTAAQTWYLP